MYSYIIYVLIYVFIYNVYINTFSKSLRKITSYICSIHINIYIILIYILIYVFIYNICINTSSKSLRKITNLRLKTFKNENILFKKQENYRRGTRKGRITFVWKEKKEKSFSELNIYIIDIMNIYDVYTRI